MPDCDRLRVKGISKSRRKPILVLQGFLWVKLYIEDDLMQKIGRMQVELVFLRSASLALGLNIERPR